MARFPFSLPTPNDARPRPPPPPPSTTSASSSPSSTSQSQSQQPQAQPTLIQRNRPLSLLIFGSVFALLSARATRRAMIKRQKSVQPHFYHPSNEPPQAPISGPLEAVEALSLATVNVFSWGMVWVGGMLWAFDIRSMDQMRRKIRGGLGVDGSGRDEKEAEEEIEEWIASVMDRGMKRKDGQEEEKRTNDRGKER